MYIFEVYAHTRCRDKEEFEEMAADLRSLGANMMADRAELQITVTGEYPPTTAGLILNAYEGKHDHYVNLKQRPASTKKAP